jgi:hypothetical protein
LRADVFVVLSFCDVRDVLVNDRFTLHIQLSREQPPRDPVKRSSRACRHYSQWVLQGHLQKLCRANGFVATYNLSQIQPLIPIGVFHHRCPERNSTQPFCSTRHPVFFSWTCYRFPHKLKPLRMPVWMTKPVAPDPMLPASSRDVTHTLAGPMFAKSEWGPGRCVGGGGSEYV